MMKRTVSVLLITVLAAGVALGQEKDSAKTGEKPIRVLLTYGGHGFKQEPFFAMFDGMEGIKYDRAPLPKSFDRLKPGLEEKYDVIVRFDMIGKIPAEQREAFAALLKERGIGLVSLHHNLGAHRDWPQYRKIIGGCYLFKAMEIDGKQHAKSTYAHWKRTDFRVVDGEHPITKGVGDFKITDNGETYGNCYVAPGVKVLVTTDQKRTTPEQVWVTRYGKSPVAYCMPGHGPQAWREPAYQAIVKQAIEWAAVGGDK